VSPVNQSLLSRIAIAISVFALLMVAVVAANKSSSSEAGGGGGTATVAISLSEFKLSPSAITVPQGGQIEVSNTGTVAHNLAITDTALKTADIDPGGKATLDVSSLAPGTYEIFCAIPGHKDSGMVGQLTVVEAGAAATAASGSSASAADHAADIGSLERTDPIAKKFNEDSMAKMDAGIKTFLDNATKYANGEIKSGNGPIKHEVLKDGTWRFKLTAAVTDWEVSPGKVVKAWTYNGTVPGPWIRVPENTKIQVDITNELPISTDIHWHGVTVPNDQDGVGGITQPYIKPGETYTYKFTTTNHPELAMYHAHFHGQEGVLNGLFASIQVGDFPLPAPGTYGDFTVPENLKIAQEFPMVLNDAGVIGLSLNGKAFPETAPIVAKQGDYLLIHYYNEGLVGHPMHLHSQPQLVIAKDGFPLVAPYQIDTLWVAPGERYSVLVKAESPGTWAYHCHILNHAESNDGLIGMVTAMIVK
jgi:FtsP/CotA-like multicopper oxidase with cupredoxin domain